MQPQLLKRVTFCDEEKVRRSGEVEFVSLSLDCVYRARRRGRADSRYFSAVG